jgi:HSP20 family protein
MQTLRFDPFRDFDRLAAEVFGTARTPSLMPMDCLRSGDQFVAPTHWRCRRRTRR